MLCRVYELPNGYAGGVAWKLKALSSIVSAFACFKLMDQIVDAERSFLVPLDQSACQRSHMLCVDVARENGQKRQRKIYYD